MVEHYSKNSVNIEIIDVVYDAPFLLGNMFKYMVRTGDKGVDDRAKAIDYAKRIDTYLDAEDFRLRIKIYKWWHKRIELLVMFSGILEEKGYPPVRRGDDVFAYINTIANLD